MGKTGQSSGSPMDRSSANEAQLYELRGQVGHSELKTEKALQTVSSISPNSRLLPIYDLLLLERFEPTIPLIRMTLENLNSLSTPDSSIQITNYLSTLQNSQYYFHRMAVPCILRHSSLPLETKRDFLSKSCQDRVGHVVKETVTTIINDEIFDKQQLADIANYLLDHEYAMMRTLAVDIIAKIRDERKFIRAALDSSSWRVRLRMGLLIKKFDSNEQTLIIDKLRNDPVEEVRVHLAANLSSLEYSFFLDDLSDQVRAIYLKNVVSKINDQTIFEKLMNDDSWEVKKFLLNLRDEWLHSVTIPLIKSSTQNVKWRMKLEILKLIEDKIEESEIARPLFGFICEAVQDKTCEIRKKAAQILKKIVERHDWSKEYTVDLERVVLSKNYLHRISILPVVVAFDKKWGKSISKPLKEDVVVNIREYYRELASESEYDK